MPSSMMIWHSSPVETRVAMACRPSDSNQAPKSRSVSMEDYLAGEPNQIVVDYLASMTDSYFMALYGHLFPRSDKQVVARSYCADLA